MEFDYRSARRQGYSDTEIVDTLGRARNFDVQAARQAGYSDQEILSRLQQPTNSTAAVAANAFGRGVTGTLGLPGTIADGVQGLVGAGYRAITGRDVPVRGNPLSAENIQGGLRSAGVLDRPGTEPQSEGQRYIAATAEGAGSGLVFGPASAALGAVGGAAGELGADVTREAGYGEGAQAVARLAGNVAGGLGASMAARAAGRVLAPVQGGSPERAALVAAAEREGINVTPGQRSGNRLLQRVEQGFADFPMTQPYEQALRAAQQDAFTAAALRRAGLTGTRATPDVLRTAERQIGGEIGTIAARNRANFQAVANDLTTLAQDAAANGAGDVPRLVSNRIMEIIGKLDPNDAMAGRAWRELDTSIRRQIQSNRANGDLVNYLGRVRDVMMDALEAGAGPAEVEALRAARRAYANLMTLESAAGRAGKDAAEGALTPSAMRAAAAESVGRRGYATGRGDFNELARAGEAVVRNPIPDSGTAGRLAIGGGLGGGALALGASVPGAAAAALSPMLLQRLYYSAPSQAYLSPAQGARAAVVNALPSLPQGAAVGAVTGAANVDPRLLRGPAR
jgi:hypothetical protein